MNREAMLSELRRDEREVLYCYDDATGAAVVPGYKLKGHPTIGIGRALDVHGLSALESLALARNDIATVEYVLAARIPWFQSLDDPRQRVLCNIAFNCGADGLLAFKNMLAAVQVGHYHLAAVHLQDSKLNQQAPGRVARLVSLLTTPPGENFIKA